MLRQTKLLAEATARQIVQRAMGIISHSVNVMDSNGVIIASGNPQRLFLRHEGAVLALAENRVVEIDRATAEKLVAGAHERCPFSRATQGNIDVVLTVADA